MNDILSRLLRKNLSTAQLIGFVLANFAGLAIVITGVQFYTDVRALWEKEDSFIRKDYIVVNKKVKTAMRPGSEETSFSSTEIEDLKKQPWVRSAGEFISADFSITGSIAGGERRLSSFMFLESLPSEYIDVKDCSWTFDPSQGSVPVIISKDYLTLYNFGFASSSGMPQISESMLGSVPLDLSLRSEDGRVEKIKGRIAGFSNRLNTILVPEEFMRYYNRTLGSGKTIRPSRLIIDVSSPGDVAISDYLETHGLEQAGDKSASRASYFLNVAASSVVSIGIVISVLSLFILMLSISLLMQKNKEKLHNLIMLGYSLKETGATYRRLIVAVTLISFLLATGAMLYFRTLYISGISGLSGGADTGIWISLCAGIILSGLILIFNICSVNRKVKAAFYK